MRIKTLPWLLLASFSLAGFAAHAQNRRVYEGVVKMKLKTIGTVILMELNGNNVSGSVRLGKFFAIDSGTVSEDFVEFHAAGNTYKIDERKGRIAYSGPDGDGDSVVGRLTPVTGRFDELTEGEQFSGSNIITMDINGRLRRFQEEGPSLWKHEGPPFESFHRMEELLQREMTIWVTDPGGQGGEIVVVEEPVGMNILLKLPKQAKEKKSKEKK